MPTLISSTTGAALTTGKPRLRLHLSVTITGLVAHLSVDVPAGVSQILIRGRAGIGGLYSVAGGTTEIIPLTRDEPSLTDHPHVLITVEALGYKTTPKKLRFERDDPAIGIPVTLTTAGTISAGVNAGTALTYTPYVWAGDVIDTEDRTWTSSTEAGTYVDEGERWTGIPDDEVGRWWKRRARAYGPTVANPLVLGWTDYQDSTPRQVGARPAARTLTLDDWEIDRSVYRPTSQSTHFTPILLFPGLEDETIDDIEFTAADVDAVSPTWNSVLPRSGETGAWDLFDKAHPVAVATSDAALFQSGSVRLPRLRVRWRPNELTPWSAASPVRTVPAPSGDPTADYTVFNMTDLVAAMAAATSGQEIAVAPGAYAGAISFQNRNKGNPGITIRPTDRANPPVFLNGTINISGSTGITFDGCIHRNTQKDTSFEHYGNGPYIYALAGGNRAFTFDDTTRFTLRNAVIEGYHLAIGQRGTTDLLIEYCRFRQIGMDCIRMYDEHIRPIIRNNIFEEPNVDHERVTEQNAQGIEERHVDFIQFAVRNDINQAGTTGAIIENNVMLGAYGYQQGVFMFNERCTRATLNLPASKTASGHNNCIIRNNYIESRQRLAIQISGATDILVEGNLIRTTLPTTRASDLNSSPPPQICVSPAANSNCYSTGIVRNNVYPPKNGITGDNNLDVVNASRTGSIDGSEAGLARSGNVRSNTAVPPNWATTDAALNKVGPYGYL